MTNMFIALLILAAVWGIAEFISIKTKAFLSLTFVAFAVLLIGSWTGLIPADIVDKAGLSTLAVLAIPLVVVHMGSTMSTEQLKKEWQTIAICAGGLVTLLLFMFTIGTFVLGKETAITATPVIYGGGLAAIILSSVLKPLGLDHLIGFAWLMASVQLFVGIPLSLFFLKKFAKKITNNDTVSELAVSITAEGVKKKGIKTCFLPSKYQTTFILLALATAIATLGVYLGEYTNKFGIHPYIVCLILSFLAVRFRIIPSNIMTKANSYGFLVFGMFVYIGIQITSSITLDVFIQLLKPAVLSFLIAVPGLALGAVIVAKLIKVDAYLALALVYTCMIGFPTTIIMAEEVSTVFGRTEEEVNILKGYLVPKMLIGGLATVSIFSGFLASILAKFL
ncbi:hypothetical protein SH2C18_27320 [Clostridium sediminicola]|uniref:hypothetical protein n=1 Tax=Clostridium sediminicola TaxID=3114879 RepID=UPI0031F257CF